jgi:pimeloyl-ACP methyl ester carboxylesterase
MMPFSVLRTWGLGLVGWITLGVGIYLIWEWTQQSETVVIPASIDSRPPRSPVGAADPASNDAADTASTPVVRQPVSADRRWPYLAWGIGLIAFSWMGYLPILPFLGRWTGMSSDRRPAARPTIVQTIFRPDGCHLHVEIFGPEHGPTLVLTHGWSLNLTAWRYLLPLLTEKFRVITWDLPGLGRSTSPANKDFSLENMARDLEAVLAETTNGDGANKSVILVGHSIGGLINQTFCRLFPEQLGTRIQGLVLLHTTYTNPLKTALLASLWRAIQTPVIVPLNYLNIWLAPLVWLSNLQSYCNGSLHIATRLSSFAGEQTLSQLNHGAWLAASAPPNVLARGNLAMLKFDEQKTLSVIDSPVLVIGARDDRMTKLAASNRLDDLLPHSHLAVLKPAGHLGFWEQPEQCAELITEFAIRCEQPVGTTPRMSKSGH